MKRNHDRSPDKKAFSVALPKPLISEIEAVAEKESRNRNKQIEYFLKKAVAEWKRNNPRYSTSFEFENSDKSEQREPWPSEEKPDTEPKKSRRSARKQSKADE